MNKKTYVSPESEMFAFNVVLLGVSGGDRGIPYGGVDRNGTQVPASRGDLLFIDDDDEEE